MRKVSLSKSIFLFTSFLLFLAGCFEGSEDNQSSINVQGRWQANVSVENCSPADVCSAYGFRQGMTVVAVMDLKQNGSKVEGKYSYQGAPINVDVSGTVSETQLVLNGNVSDALGRATVALVGAVSGGTIDAAVSHQVSVAGGPTGSLSGSGDFVR